MLKFEEITDSCFLQSKSCIVTFVISGKIEHDSSQYLHHCILFFRFVPSNASRYDETAEVTKVFPLNPIGTTQAQADLMMTKRDLIERLSYTGCTITIRGVFSFNVDIIIPPLIYYRGSELYRGLIRYKTQYITPEDMSPDSDNYPAPGNFMTVDEEDEEGEAEPLVSAGMFSLIAMDLDGNILTPVDDIQIKIPSSALSRVDGRKMHLYGLRPDSGYWRELSDFDRVGDDLAATISFSVQWNWFNFDIRDTACYVKVRTFEDPNDLSALGQSDAAFVELYTVRNDPLMSQATSGYTSFPGGACIRSICESRSRRKPIYHGYLTAKDQSGTPLYGAARISTLSSLSKSRRNYYDYDVNGRAITFRLRPHKKGPVYRTLEQCLSAPFNGHSSFRFYPKPFQIQCFPPNVPNEDCDGCICPPPLREFHIRLQDKDGSAIAGANIIQFGGVANVTDDRGSTSLCRNVSDPQIVIVSAENYPNTTHMCQPGNNHLSVGGPGKMNRQVERSS